jgi:serine/threonine protein kinase
LNAATSIFWPLQELELVRLAANKLKVFSLPEWFWKLPKLSWLAIAGNLDNLDDKTGTTSEGLSFSIHDSVVTTNLIEWTDLEIMDKLGEGASGVIYKAKWNGQDIKPIDGKTTSNTDKIVALKIFKGGKTSDGLPEDEMKASEAAGCHPCSLEVLGRTINAPDGQLGLVMPLIPCEYTILGGPPSFESVTRDTFQTGKSFTLEEIVRILSGVSSVCAHLHGRGISHGDIYAHNILVTRQGKPLLSDFGASYFYSRTPDIADDAVGSSTISASVEAFEVRAFGCLMDDLLDRARDDGKDVTESVEGEGNDRKRSITKLIYSDVMATLRTLQSACMTCSVLDRPTFKFLCAQFENIDLA